MKCMANASLAACLVVGSSPVLAETDWMSFTMDNGALVGTDNGYTNGLYFSYGTVSHVTLSATCASTPAE